LALIYNDEDAALLEKLKSRNRHFRTDRKGDMLPIEDITAENFIGKTWSGGKLINTSNARIFYGTRNAHIVPIGGMDYD